MTRLLSLIVAGTLLCCCQAKTSDLEKFLTSGFDSEKNGENQDKQSTAKAAEEQFMELMRRAGLLETANSSQKQASLQALNPQPAIYFVPEESQLTNYVVPKRKLETPQQNQQILSSSTAPITQASTNQHYASPVPQQSGTTKTVNKEDRQGLYAQDGLYNTGYTGNHVGGYADNRDAYLNDGYGGGLKYVPEPVYHKPPVYHPPAVKINIDPLNILRILLRGIPRPLLNLNGKIFFGVELGKKAGIAKDVGGYVQQHPSYGYQG